VQFGLQKPDLRNLSGSRLGDSGHVAVACGVVILALRLCAAQWASHGFAQDEELTGFLNGNEPFYVVGVLRVEQSESFSPVLRDTNQPDGFRVEPFKVPSSHSSSSATVSSSAAMRQLRPPERASITLRDRQPSSFVFRDCRFEVEHAYGPWLAEGDWWNRQTWALEQWDLIGRSSDGGMLCCCLVRDLKEQSWQVVTLYD
jgi:hypothetical protein